MHSIGRQLGDNDTDLVDFRDSFLRKQALVARIMGTRALSVTPLE